MPIRHDLPVLFSSGRVLPSHLQLLRLLPDGIVAAGDHHEGILLMHLVYRDGHHALLEVIELDGMVVIALA